MRYRSIFLMLCLLSSSVMTAENETDTEYEAGFLTSYLNNALSRSLDNTTSADTTKMHYGRSVKDYVSVPQFGGYVVGKYGYTDKSGTTPNNAFEARLVRMYVSGFILRDFKYRVQVELKGTPSMRDYTLEWLHWKEFQVKVGQFKRCFTFENPFSPWDVGFGGYSQLAMNMTAFGKEDPSGEPSQNGRDVGLQFSGDVLPVGKDGHRLFRYQAAVYNGNGQNNKDNNNKKDWIGNIQVQPVKDLYVALFGWKGTYTRNEVTVGRSRWALSARYDRRDWTFRAEYAHHSGHSISDYNYDATTRTQTLKAYAGNARADGWYAAVGVPCTKWLKTYVRYDVFRKDATWGTTRTLYSICPNFQLHKNLNFQLQYNFVCDKTNPSDRHYNELWAETWVRF